MVGIYKCGGWFGYSLDKGRVGPFSKATSIERLIELLLKEDTAATVDAKRHGYAPLIPVELCKW